MNWSVKTKAAFSNLIAVLCLAVYASLLSCSITNYWDNLDANSITISDPSEGTTITTFEYTFSGTCDSDLSLSASSDSSESTIISSSCTNSVLSVKIGFKSGSGTRQITISNGEGSLIRTVTFNKTCPTGFIGVPGNTSLSVSDFCVAKYEMKGDPGPAVSTATDSPWVSITRAAAESECTGQAPWTMLTNAQWQTIARNVEASGVNWDGGIVGTNGISRGHSNGVGTLVADSSDSNGCVGLTAANTWDGSDPTDDCDGGTFHLNRRTQILSNGEVIWDLGGNVWDWVADDITAELNPNPSLSFNNGYMEFSDLTSCAAGAPCFPDASANRDFFAPLGDYDSTQGMGQVFVWTYGGAVIRGGGAILGANGGAFTANLSVSSGLSSGDVGFRCAAP